MKKINELIDESVCEKEDGAILIVPIEKKKLKKAKEILKRIKEKRPSSYSPPPGKFDDVYFSGIEMLENGESVTNQIRGHGDADCIIEGVACVKDVNFDD